MADPMYSTDAEGEDRDQPEPGDFEDDQQPADRAPESGNAPAPGQRPSESGSPPSDIPTDGDTVLAGGLLVGRRGRKPGLWSVSLIRDRENVKARRAGSYWSR
jgi:hypothetical protein